MLANAHQQYFESQLETASPGKLLIMLYDGAIRFLTQAIGAMEQNDIQTAHNATLRAEDIVTEFMATLNMEAGGEIAKNLYRLHEYQSWRLRQSLAKRDVEGLKEVQGALRELREAWLEAVKSTAVRNQVASA